MSLIDNINPEKNPLTTWIGISFLIISIGVYLSGFYLQNIVVNEMPLFVLFICGLGLVLAPDAIVEGIRNLIKKKTS